MRTYTGRLYNLVVTREPFCTVTAMKLDTQFGMGVSEAVSAPIDWQTIGRADSV